MRSCWNLGSRSFTIIIPNDDGPKASVRVSKETEPGKCQHVFGFWYSTGKELVFTIDQFLETHGDWLSLQYVFQGHFLKLIFIAGMEDGIDSVNIAKM